MKTLEKCIILIFLMLPSYMSYAGEFTYEPTGVHPSGNLISCFGETSAKRFGYDLQVRLEAGMNFNQAVQDLKPKMFGADYECYGSNNAVAELFLDRENGIIDIPAVYDMALKKSSNFPIYMVESYVTDLDSNVTITGDSPLGTLYTVFSSMHVKKTQSRTITQPQRKPMN